MAPSVGIISCTTTTMLLMSLKLMQGLAFLPQSSSSNIVHQHQQQSSSKLPTRLPHPVPDFVLTNYDGSSNQSAATIMPPSATTTSLYHHPPNPKTSGSKPADELPNTPPSSPRGHSDDADMLTFPPKSMGVNRESGSNFVFWIFTWPRRELLPGVRGPVIINLIWTLLTIKLYQEEMFTSLDATPHNLLAGALGFLLTFRASEGYSRCVEGRTVWDGVLNRCRDIVRTVIACGDMLGPERTRRIIDLTCAYGITLADFVLTVSG